MRRVVTTLVLAALAATALIIHLDNGDSGSSSNAQGGADAGDVAVIKAWSDALRSGNVTRAASYFRLPSLVENGTPPIELRSRTDVLAFNRSLPCGARLVHASTRGQVTTATFVLTDRPGGGCGPGVGQTASTAFSIIGGKISVWKRVPDAGAPASPAPGQVV
jgi:hypothetical protein